MLEVVPEFRRHGIAQALEAALIRLHLERGWLPFCFVAPDNVPSLAAGQARADEHPHPGHLVILRK